MKSTILSCCVVAALLAGMAVSVTLALAADMPEPPKVSTFAPAADLASQLEQYVEELEESVQSESEYADAKESMVRDADTALLIALALGMHDQPNQYKKAAPGLIEAARGISAAESYQQAKAAVQSLKGAMNSNGDPSKLSWQDAQAASLEALMKEVPLVNTKMKRYLRGSRFKSKADDTAGQSAVLAVIAQGSMPLASKTEKPGEAEKWYVFCADMREAAARLNKIIHSQEESAVDQAVKDLTQSCDDCHAVFEPNAKVE